MAMTYEQRNDIYGAARDRTRQLRLAALEERSGQDDTAMAAFALSVDVWRRVGDDGRRVEVLLSTGGPSDGIDIDEHDRVWYWSTETGSYDRIPLPDDIGAPWLQHFGEIWD